jgi:DNA-binding GntR family transcriptional regulator
MSSDPRTLKSISTPIPFTTKAEAVYSEIRRRILSGVLEPSAPLNQEALAPEFGVSVTPVREAVRRLEAEGLVRFQAHKTVIVAPLSRDELREIYDLRLTLDPYAASLATSKVTDEELDEIERRARAPVSDDPLEQVALNHAFHRGIYSRCGNALLTEILDRLWERTDRYRIMLVRRDMHVLAAVREHVEIAAAMRARKPRSVARLTRAHIANARSQIENALR